MDRPTWIDEVFDEKYHVAAEYDPSEDAFDPELVRKMLRPGRHLANYFRTELVGTHKLPADGCMCVSNHAILGIDSMALFARVYQNTGRMLRGLADHHVFKVPVLNSLMIRVGAVDGNRDNAVRLMKAGHWAICYPGGSLDSFKGPEDKYKLKWEGRVGYLRCALAAGKPVVPIAGIGIDEAFVAVGKEKVLGRRIFGKKRYDLPIVVGLGLMPVPVKFRFIFGDPIDPEALGLSASDAEGPVERLVDAHQEIWRRNQELIDAGLRSRINRFL